jgi:hypothetical protein
MARPHVEDTKISTACEKMFTRTSGNDTKAEGLARAILRPEQIASLQTSVYLSTLLSYALFYTKLTLRYGILKFKPLRPELNPSAQRCLPRFFNF